MAFGFITNRSVKLLLVCLEGKVCLPPLGSVAYFSFYKCVVSVPDDPTSDMFGTNIFSSVQITYSHTMYIVWQTPNIYCKKKWSKFYFLRSCKH